MLEAAAVPNSSITFEKYILKCTSRQEVPSEKIVVRLSTRTPVGERQVVPAEERRCGSQKQSGGHASGKTRSTPSFCEKLARLDACLDEETDFAGEQLALADGRVLDCMIDGQHRRIGKRSIRLPPQNRERPEDGTAGEKPIAFAQVGSTRQPVSANLFPRGSSANRI